MQEDSTLATIEIPEAFICPLSTQLFYDPVTASDGHTYEREKLEEIFSRAKNNGLTPISPNTRQPLQINIVIENASMRSQVRNFVSKLSPENKQKLYADDEIYLPTSMKQRLAMAINEEAIDRIKACLDLECDPRLRTFALEASGKDCVSLACDQKNPAVLLLIISKLKEEEKQELLKANDKTHQRLHAIAVNMQLPGLMVWREGLGLEEFAFFANCAFFAVLKNDMVLLENSLKKVTIDLTKEKESQNFLHYLVMAASSESDQDERRKVEDRLPMIRCLIAGNINTKLKNAQSLTPYELALKLKLNELAEQIKKEYWEHKHRTTLDPMRSTIDHLAQENAKLQCDKVNLEAALVSQSARTEVLEREQRQAQNNIAALSRAFRDLIHKREVVEFKASTVRSLSIGKKLKHLCIINDRFLIAASSENNNQKGEFGIWDLQHAANTPKIVLQKAERNSFENSGIDIQDAGKSRILYIKGQVKSRQEKGIVLGLFSLESWKELASYEVDLRSIRFMQTIDQSRLFMIDDNKGCYIFNFDSGILEKFPHFKVSDGSRGSGQFVVTGRSLSPVIAYLRPDNYSTEGLRLYNILTQQDRQVTTSELYGIKQFGSDIVKFLSPTILAIQKSENRNEALRLLDTQSGNYIETYAAPTLGTGFNSNTPSFCDICFVGTDKLATVHSVSTSKHAGAEVMVWDRSSKACLQTLHIPAKDHDSLSIVYEPVSDLLYVTVEMNVFAIKYRAPDLTPDIAGLTEEFSEFGLKK